jgi:hypothetical protein
MAQSNTVLSSNKPLVQDAQLKHVVGRLSQIHVESPECPSVVCILPVFDNEFGKELIPSTFPRLIPGKGPPRELGFFKIGKEENSVDRGNFLSHLGEGSCWNSVYCME